MQRMPEDDLVRCRASDRLLAALSQNADEKSVTVLITFPGWGKAPAGGARDADVFNPALVPAPPPGIALEGA
ncbi:hypothetical protein [Tsuneonella sp. SYSU-LHT278]|uniref:hypothetical protein n=1 Tax=Tsuneonella sediminis TaxID=3416089 RepID=UPI003F79B46E